jgi:hypothetical protein
MEPIITINEYPIGWEWLDKVPLEQNKEVQTKIKEIIYNNLYDTLIDELKGTISRFQAQYNIQEINPYLQDILQNPEDLVSHSQHHKR